MIDAVILRSVEQLEDIIVKISKMTSLLEPSSSPCSPKTSASLKMTGMSNDQMKIGHTANNGQMSNGQSPIEQASNGQRLAANGKANGVRSNGRDESEARYCEFTRQSILEDPRCFGHP